MNKLVGQLTVKIDDDLEKKFRKAVFERKGLRRGDIQDSIAEAIELWVKTG